MITIEQLKDVKERTEALYRYLDIEGKKIQVEEEQLRTQLEQQAGTFTASSFVKGQMGVDNVCERSACAASGGGEKIVAKTACDGITVAVYKIKRNEE